MYSDQASSPYMLWGTHIQTWLICKFCLTGWLPNPMQQGPHACASKRRNKYGCTRLGRASNGPLFLQGHGSYCKALSAKTANFDLDLSKFQGLKSPIWIILCDISQKRDNVMPQIFVFRGEKSCKILIKQQHIKVIRGFMYILLNISHNR